MLDTPTAAPVTRAGEPLRAFFASLRPTGFLNLVSINPAGGHTTGATFGPDEPGGLDAAVDWAQSAQQNGRNCYFTVNPVRDPKLSKKPTKADIAAPEFCQIDIDPAADPNDPSIYFDSRGRLLGAVLDDLKAFDPEPTYIIDSGHGLGAFWRIEDGDVDGVEVLNRRLIKRFGGDAGTWNVDRLMRPPGLHNLPSAQKVRRGYPAGIKETRLLHVSDSHCVMVELAANLPELGEGSPDSAEDVPFKDATGEFTEDTTPLNAFEAELADAGLAHALTESPNLALLWKGTALPGQTDPSRSGFDFAAAGLLKSLGFTYREAEYLLTCRFPFGKVAEAGPREARRAWQKSQTRATYTLEALFGEPGDGPPPPPLPEGGSGELFTEGVLQNRIDALAPGGDVGDLLGQAVTIDRVRTSDIHAKQVCDKIADAVAVAKAVVWTEFKKLRRTYAVEVKKARRVAPVDGSPQQRVEAALEVMRTGPFGECSTIAEVAARFLWVNAEGAFFDRVCSMLVPRASLDGYYAHVPQLSTSEDERPVSASTVLLADPRCVKVDTLDYWPGNDVGAYREGDQVHLNTWLPSEGMRPVRGDITPWVKHLEWLVPDPAERLYLVQWMAFVYRCQHLKINHNVLLGGAPRIGKDTLLLPLIAGVGDKSTSLISADKLMADFEDWAVNKKLVVLNEFFYHGAGMGQRGLENRLKPFGAAPPEKLSLRRFGASAGHPQRNLIQMVATTNYRDAAEMHTGADRWFCVWCDPKEPMGGEYYDWLYKWLEGGGNAAVLYYLKEGVNLGGFDPKGRAPLTEWRGDMQDDAMHADPINLYAEKIAELVALRYGPFEHDLVKLDDVVDVLRTQLMGDRQLRMNRKNASAALRRFGAVYSKNKTVRREDGATTSFSCWAVRKINFWSAKERTGVEWYEKFISQ